MKTVIRKQYRAQLQEIPEEQALSAFALCREQAAGLIRQGGAMTAAMYRYGRQLFLYMEYLDEELSPEVLFPGLQDCLSPWPTGSGKRHRASGAEGLPCSGMKTCLNMSNTTTHW